MFRRRRQGVELPEVVHRAVQLVRPGLGDHVDEAAARAAELRVGAVGDHDDLVHGVHGVQVEGEGGTLAAPLLPEKGIVEVGAVHRDVVVDAALAGDGEFLSVGSLDDRDVRGQQRQVEKIAPVVGQPLHRLIRETGRCLGAGRIDRRRRGHDRDALQLDRPSQGDLEVDRFADAKRDPGLRVLLQPDGSDRHVVQAERQQRSGEGPRRGRVHLAHEVGAGLPELDLRVDHGVAGYVQHRAPDDAGRRLGLAQESRWSKHQEAQRPGDCNQ